MSKFFFDETQFVNINNNDDKKFSITEKLELNADKEIKRFFELINTLGSKKFLNKKFFEFFSYKNYFNFWFLSDFYEKNIWKNPEIIKILKINYIKRLIEENKIDKISGYITDYRLYSAIVKICDKNKVKINLIFKNKTFIQRAFEIKFFLVFKTLIIFIFQSFKDIIFSDIKKNKSDKLIISYSNIIKKNKITNFYWENLQNNNFNLKEYDHLLIDAFNNLSKSEERKILNNSKEYYRLISSYQNFFSIFITLKIYFRIILILIISSLFLKNFLNNDYLKFYFYNSFLSFSAIKNINFYFLFCNFFKNNKYTEISYLFENISWEKSLNILQGSKLKAFQHTSVRKWDMRYREDYYFKDSYLYLPKNIYANTKESQNRLIRNFKNSKIIKIEKSRFSNIKKQKLLNKNNQIIILADINNEVTYQMLELFDKKYVDKDFVIKLKQHPATKVNLSSHEVIEITDKDIRSLTEEYDYFLCSSSSTSIFEILIAGKIPFVYKNNYCLDLCPIENLSDMNVIRTSNDLKKFYNINYENFENDKKKYEKFLEL